MRIPSKVKAFGIGTALGAFGLGMTALVLSPAIAGVETVDAARVSAGTYTVDTSHTSAIGRADHMGFSFTNIVFSNITGSLTYDPANPKAATLDITIDTTTANSGFAARDAHVKGPQLLNIAAFPTMRYVASSLMPVDASHARVDGTLTMLGVSKPVSLDVTLVGAGTGMRKEPRIGFIATGTLRRSDFGMTGFASAVGDTVELRIDSEFSKK